MIVVGYKRKYVHKVLVNCLFKLAQEKSVLRWTDRPNMTIAVDLERKATKQTNKQVTSHICDQYQTPVNGLKCCVAFS